MLTLTHLRIEKSKLLLHFGGKNTVTSSSPWSVSANKSTLQRPSISFTNVPMAWLQLCLLQHAMTVDKAQGCYSPWKNREAQEKRIFSYCNNYPKVAGDA